MSAAIRLTLRAAQFTAAFLAAALLAGCERPPVTAVQSGYRGTGMEQINNPRIDAKTVAMNVAPAAAAAAT